jgi:hypothetical protein
VTGGGAKLQPSIAPVVQSGVLWVRVEALRGLGWWVPLRRVSELLGWRVQWRHTTREAVVFTTGMNSARP